ELPWSAQYLWSKNFSNISGGITKDFVPIMKKPLSVILMWHMHQPLYKDPVSGEYILPWTYLHAVKDYFDMAAIVDEVQGARAVFNFVPSLLEQLDDYAAGTARDQFLVHGMMDSNMMGEKERLFVISNFFAANRQRLI